MIFNDSLLIFEDEIRERSFWQAFVEFLRKHTFSLRPIHRYRGQLTLIGDVLGIDMRHVSTSAPLHVNIPLRNIVGLDMRFFSTLQSVLRQRLYQQVVPVGVRYEDENGKDVTIYLFASYDHGLAVNPNCRNEELFEALSHRILELKAKKS
jgi:hypothetical protein